MGTTSTHGFLYSMYVHRRNIRSPLRKMEAIVDIIGPVNLCAIDMVGGSYISTDK